MTHKLWSINGLAAEFGLDRRTVAERLATVAPAGQVRGSPAWRLRDAVPVLAPIMEAARARDRAEMARERYYTANAAKAELDVAQKRGELVPVAEVQRADELIVTMIRDRVMALESVAPLVMDAAQREGEHGVRMALRRAARDALADLAGAELVAAPGA